MTLETRASTIERARTLAIPTIRAILRKRRNAAKHSKIKLLVDLNYDLDLTVQAALGLGLDGATLVACTTQHPDDSRVLAAMVVRATKGDS